MRRYGIEDESQIDAALIKRVLGAWIDAVLFIDRALYEDAKKEYKIMHRITYGINVYDDDRVDELRENFDDIPLVVSVKEHMDRKRKLYDFALSLLG